MKKNDVNVPDTPRLRGPRWGLILILFNAVFVMADSPHIGEIAIFLWGLCAGLIVKGVKNKDKERQMNTFRNIARVLGDAQCAYIPKLAQQVGMNEAVLTNTLVEMLRRGYLGSEAFIDYNARELVLVRDTMRTDEPAYADARMAQDTIGQLLEQLNARAAHLADEENGRAARPFGEGLNAQRTAPQSAPTAYEPPKPAQPSKEEQYEKTLADIRALNDRIADKEVSEKIDRIGAVTSSIFSYLRIHPENEDEVRKFMGYYLPTTFKLLESYALMEKQSYQGENISASRRKIEDILNTLVSAFEQQQDRLFRTEAMDLGADIDVLSTMLRKDGLVGEAEDPFAQRTAQGE